MFISHRWGERANRQGFEHFCVKHDLDRAHIDEKIGFANQVLRQGPLFTRCRRPVRRALARVGLARVESALALALFAVERVVNRIFIRPGPTTL